MLSNFKFLPKGVQRSIIVGSFILPFIMGYIIFGREQDWFFVAVFFCVPAYWVLAFAGIWIYKGFINHK